MPIPEELRARLSVPNKSGVILLTVEQGGKADQAGALIGDLVIGLGEQSIEDIEDLQSFTDSGVIGESVTIRLVRGGMLKESTVVVGERPGREK